MQAAILAIGDELVLGESLDTNSAWLAAQLRERAVEVREHRTVGDDAQLIASALRELAEQCELIITTGGLGPTADDLTRHGLGLAVTGDEPLVEDEHARRRLELMYKRRGRTMAPTNLLQTLRPKTSRMLENHNGTAMGLSDSIGTCRVIVLPGPPREMKPMFEQHVLPLLPAADDDDVALTRFVHGYGLAESEAAHRLGDLLTRGRSPQIGITVSDAILTVRIRGRGERSTLQQQIDADAEAVRRALHPYVYGIDAQTLSAAVGALLNERAATVATAESCTGGMLGALLVDVAGSSSYYLGGWVTYTNEMKDAELGVDAAMIAAHGAVSRETADAMARGALQRSGAEYALSITGIAGPGGDLPGKPVGLVYIGLAHRRGDAPAVAVRRFKFVGDRMMIRRRSANSALQMLRLALLGEDERVPLLWEVREEPADAQRDTSTTQSISTGDGI